MPVDNNLNTFDYNTATGTSNATPSPLAVIVRDSTQSLLIPNLYHKRLSPDVLSLPEKIKEFAEFLFKEFHVNPFEKLDNKVEVFLISDPRYQNNACWSTPRMYFGESDPGRTPTMRQIDIICHELGHSVTTATCKLNNQGESGALDESMADIFAIMFKHKKANTKVDDPQTNWNVAEHFELDGGPLRSIKDPKVAHYDDKKITHLDHGGVHDNSGIPSKAFYLASKAIGGGTWQTTGKVWYKAFTTLNNNNATFKEFAENTLKQSENLNCDAMVFHDVVNAWKDVGIKIKPFIKL